MERRLHRFPLVGGLPEFPHRFLLQHRRRDLRPGPGQEDLPGEVLLFGPGLALEGAEPVGEPAEIAGGEEGREDLLPVLRVGQQEFLEIPLGDHRHLGKLLGGKPDNLIDLFIDRLDGRQDAPVRQPQLGRSRMGGHPLPPRLRAVVAGGTGDGVDAPPAAEGEGDARLQIGGGKAAPEGIGLPDAPACLAEQGVGDAVEDGGLAGAGVPGDQKQPLLPKAGEIHLRLPGIGPEGGHRQFNRPHTCPPSGSPQISSIVSRTSIASSGESLTPCICS